MSLTQERLKEMLRYDPETGHFWWLKRGGRRSKVKFDQPAGYPNFYGHIVIGIDNKRYYAHRLAWFYMTGAWPEREIDHINVVSGDNRWINLREAHHHQNLNNIHAHADSRTGLKGIVEHKPGVWRARIRSAGKTYCLGLHGTPEAAHEAYKQAAANLNGEFARAA